MVAFVWGDELNEPKNVQKMKELGLDGIIYDRIGEVESRQNVFIVERDARRSLFSASPGPSRSASLDKKTAQQKEFPQNLLSLDIAVPTLTTNGNSNNESSSSSTATTPRALSPTFKKSGRFNEI